MKDLASAIAMGESLVDFKNSTIHDGEKAKSWPKEKKFEKKTTKNPSWKPTGKKLREDQSKPKGKSIGGQRSKSSVTLSVMDHIGQRVPETRKACCICCKRQQRLRLSSKSQSSVVVRKYLSYQGHLTVTSQ